MLFLAVVLLSLPQAALLPLLDRDEPRFAEASREMLQSGNFVVPTFNHAPRYAKPPLIYWCQALSYSLFGENAFAARLPSLLATAGTALLLFAWGVQIGDKNIGLIAGLAYAFCLQTVQQGRVATADALLIFFMTLTAFLGWQLLHCRPTPGEELQGRSPRRAMCGRFALALAAGFLAKGPEAWLPLVALLICARSWRERGTLLGFFALSAALVAGWAIPAYVETHGDYWRVGLSEGVGERMVSGLQGHGASTFGWYLLSVPLYLLLFWLSALPWSPLLLTHAKKLFASWKPDFMDTYLLLNAGLIFVVFSLMVTKLPHYTLPAFPFLALLFARRWISSGLNPGLPIRLAGGIGIILAFLTTILVPMALTNHATPSPVGELVRKANDVLTPQTEFALVDFQEPNAVWEMRRACQGYGQFIADSSVVEFLNRSGPRAVVLSTPLWQKLRVNADPTWNVMEARGWNTAKGWDSAKHTFAFIDLTLVVKP